MLIVLWWRMAVLVMFPETCFLKMVGSVFTIQLSGLLRCDTVSFVSDSYVLKDEDGFIYRVKHYKKNCLHSLLHP
jgi:hypothetical protein